MTLSRLGVVLKGRCQKHPEGGCPELELELGGPISISSYFQIKRDSKLENVV